jgi:DNA-binding beta-propeller fold protein YncE
VSHALYVALGDQRYRVERPFGDLPGTPGGVSDVAAGPDGRVHVLLRPDPLTDGDAPRLVTLDAQGRRLSAFGADTIADGHMMTAAPDGRLLVVDRDAHQVVILDGAGRQVGALGERHRPLHPFNHPTSVAVAPDGTIYVADGYAAARVHRFDPDGTPRGAWGRLGGADGAFHTPHGIAVLPDGRVAVGDRENHRVQVFDPEGHLRAVLLHVHRPMALWADARGRLLVSDSAPCLTLFEADGTLAARCRPVLNSAHGLCGDAQGHLYLAEMNPRRVTRLVPVPAGEGLR